MKTIVPVMGEDINQISLVLDKLIGKDIDIIELRVDYLKYITKDSINNSIEKIRLAGFKTIILTLRSIKDGGRYDQKIYTKLIDFFLDFEIDYIDIEIDNIEKNEAYALVKKAKENGVKVIFSKHELKGGIKANKVIELYQLANKMQVSICKIVDRSDDMQHIIERINQAKHLENPKGPELISITMGAKGRISRINSKNYHPKYTFINASGIENLGQINIDDLENILNKEFEIIFCFVIQSPLGQIYLYSDGCSLTKLSYEKEEEKEHTILIEAEIDILREASKQLEEYFQGKRQDFNLKIKVAGTKKEKEIYKNLKKIPFANTITYKELAFVSGIENGARFCGNTMAKNKLPIIVPCHRVIKSDGSWGQYIGGLERKDKLLKIERNYHA